MIEWLLLQTELPTFCSRPSQVTVAGGGTAELICPDMSSTILLILLLSAHITGLISEQLLRAAVGGSVLIPCSLHDNRTLSSVYWQEGLTTFLWKMIGKHSLPTLNSIRRSNLKNGADPRCRFQIH
ncbi:uncharacterized protein LOC119025586 isoform X4 [Acanthopagrus latus]|uniref:uncharacterized protein LOC119025586 isoform X4 n=1 Tax=Acanthopagrus latus TaxID=8177 RepID=UPI00187BDBA7|nr:uncharacterized protein LOC119025586 isoform X4 [Acanthopagrus latus]